MEVIMMSFLRKAIVLLLILSIVLVSCDMPGPTPIGWRENQSSVTYDDVHNDSDVPDFFGTNQTLIDDAHPDDWGSYIDDDGNVICAEFEGDDCMGDTELGYKCFAGQGCYLFIQGSVFFVPGEDGYDYADTLFDLNEDLEQQNRNKWLFGAGTVEIGVGIGALIFIEFTWPAFLLMGAGVITVGASGGPEGDTDSADKDANDLWEDLLKYRIH